MEVLVFTPLVPRASRGDVSGGARLGPECCAEIGPEDAGVRDRCPMRRRVDRGEGDGPGEQFGAGTRESGGTRDDADGAGGGAAEAGMGVRSGVGFEVLRSLSSRGVPFDFDTAGFSFDGDEGEGNEGEG